MRIWEIDFIRGLAIILMIIFHFIVDLKDFYSYGVEYLSGFWYIEGKLSAILFMLICGVSSTLGTNSTQHGIKVFLWAMLLTVGTYFYNENCYIRFGILHFLGISLLSAHFIHRLPTYWIMMLSGASILVGILFSTYYVSNPYLFPIGLINSAFISMDYYPIFPWYGVYLFGFALGKTFYGDETNFPFLQTSHQGSEILVNLFSSSPFKPISWLGQHSLAIYLIHQPILLLALYLFHGR